MEVGRATNQPDVSEQLRLLNLIRQWSYAMQRQLGLDLSVNFCARVECFCQECPPCPEKPYYYGFRLPAKYQSLEAVRLRNEHVPVFSPWRLPYDGVSGFPNDGSAKLFDNGWSPLERDFSNCMPKRLRMWAEACPNACQKVRITGRTLEDRIETFDYDVGRDTLLTDEVFREVTNIQIAEGVVGRIIISEFDGRELARIGTGVTSPQYREYKLVGGCNPKQLVLIANCSYEDVSDDLDICEFGNPLVWSTLAKYLQLLNKSDKDSNDRANMNNYLETAVGLMKEQSAVESSENLETRIRRASIKSSRLGGDYYRARR